MQEIFDGLHKNEEREINDWEEAFRRQGSDPYRRRKGCATSAKTADSKESICRSKGLYIIMRQRP
ncbi:MAG TPA: hypothetical protein DHV36_02580 [Desulfobacteraceae bacterium]|nr:hypothetical protein [Desulfobacteraceae bacterium]